MSNDSNQEGIKSVEITDIRRAAEVIGGFLHKTPLIHCNSFSSITGAEVYIKAENLQKTGSFKVRGAFNRLHSLNSTNVIAASMGNHAQGVAFAASKLGIKAKIVMPLSASIVKQEATKGYGAEILLHGESFVEALEFARSQKGYSFIHSFDDEMIIAGQGTIGLEIIQDLKDIDVILVPVGGGGLISGIAVAVKALSPGTRIIGVQTASADSAFTSFRDKQITAKVPSSTLADGIAVGEVGRITFDLMNRYVDEIVTVDESSIAMAILLFLERKKLVVEGAGTVPLAALIERKESFVGKRVVLVVSGGNIDFTLIDRIIHKGLVSSGRIGTFEVKVDDSPGQLHALTGIIAGQRGNIHTIVHDRLSPELSAVETKVVFTVETRGKEHLEEIISEIRSHDFYIRQIQ
jgi:threonine dehydratase